MPLLLRRKSVIFALVIRLNKCRNAYLHGIRFSMLPYRHETWMDNVPLYAINAYFNRK